MRLHGEIQLDRKFVFYRKDAPAAADCRRDVPAFGRGQPPRAIRAAGAQRLNGTHGTIESAISPIRSQRPARSDLPHADTPKRRYADTLLSRHTGCQQLRVRLFIPRLSQLMQ